MTDRLVEELDADGRAAPAHSRGNNITSKQFGNADWVRREAGRIPTKGAAAAERASAGIGTLDDDAALRAYELPPKRKPSLP